MGAWVVAEELMNCSCKHKPQQRETRPATGSLWGGQTGLYNVLLWDMSAVELVCSGRMAWLDLQVVLTFDTCCSVEAAQPASC